MKRRMREAGERILFWAITETVRERSRPVWESRRPLPKPYGSLKMLFKIADFPFPSMILTAEGLLPRITDEDFQDMDKIFIQIEINQGLYLNSKTNRIVGSRIKEVRERVRKVFRTFSVTF